MKTDVAIIGAGPSGMLLSHLLFQAGISCVVLERQTRPYVQGRVRAGLLEAGTVSLLRDVGLGTRMDAEGFVHDGTAIAHPGGLVRIDFKARTGKSVMIYGQTEVQKDLFAAGDANGIEVVEEAEDIRFDGIDSGEDADASGASGGLTVTYAHHGQQKTLEARYVAGCDGFHGVSRLAIPPSILKEYERVYPFGWLGVLSESRPVSHELIYSRHHRGFALCTMRNQSLSRYYVQCDIDADPAATSDAQFWDELRRRLPAETAEVLETGTIIEKSVAPLRSYVAEPMRFGRLFLVGDAAHIVPPTGAKGLNLAVADVRLLAKGLADRFSDGDCDLLDRYSELALARAWKAARFSWWMTTMLHTFPDASPFDARIQDAELDYLANSDAAQTVMAENYVGLPLPAL